MIVSEYIVLHPDWWSDFPSRNLMTIEYLDGKREVICRESLVYDTPENILRDIGNAKVISLGKDQLP